jgi:hypothetical protein
MAVWQFRPLNPNENSGASTVDDNFAVEERTSVEILVRETLQNPLDARGAPGDLVRVSYRIVSLDAGRSRFAKALFDGDWEKHAAAGSLRKNGIPASVRFLVIEDFGTTGLEGTYEDSSVDGDRENWNAFWFREGEGAKQSKSNGGAGQGKITLYLASEVRSVIALTKRRSDQRELLFGCCRFRRNYRLDGNTMRWAKEARWGATSNPDVLANPVTDAGLIEAAKSELGLLRGDQPGTSFIVPLPLGDITEDRLREAVINEFFFAISRGRLEVTVGDAVLDKATIARQADAMARPRLSGGYRNFLALSAGRIGQPAFALAKSTWSKKADATAFAPEVLEQLKNTFELGEPIWVDFPLMIRPSGGKAGETRFRVFLQQDPELEKSEELFVRQDLAIDGEKKLRSVKAVMPVMALTFIDDPVLSDLLVCAEEPTHRTWNAQRPKVKASYAAPGDALSVVRNAAAKLIGLIAPLGKRDETALAIYFADPSSSLQTKKGAKGDKQEKEKPGAPFPVDIPPPKPKPVRLTTQPDGFSVQTSTHEDATFAPLDCTAELAYATVHGDSFALWDAADFWLGDEVAFPVASNSVSGLVRDGNIMRFRLDSQDARLTVGGFDKNRQLDVRLKYREVQSEADLAHD